MGSSSTVSTASKTSTSATKSGDATGTATVSPSALQKYAKDCFSSNKNFFQCQAKSPMNAGKPESVQQGTQRVVHGWYIGCCDADLVLDKCAQSLHFGVNCKSDGDYSLDYVHDPDETTSSSSTPSSTSSSTQSAVSSDKSMSSGAIAGAVVGSVIGAAFLAILAAALLWRKRKAQQELVEKETETVSRGNPPSYHGEGFDSFAGQKEPCIPSTSGYSASGPSVLGSSAFESSALESSPPGFPQAIAPLELPISREPLELPPGNEQHELPSDPLLSGEYANTTPTELPANTPSNLPAHPSTHPEPS